MGIERSLNAPIRTLLKMLLDVGAFILALVISYLIRFPLDSFSYYFGEIAPLAPVFLLIRLGCFILFKLYKTMWRYSGVHALVRIIEATTLGSLVFIGLAYFASRTGLPRSVMMTDWMLVIFLTGGTRLSIRYIFSVNWDPGRSTRATHRVLICGAGKAGELLLRNIESSRNANIDVIGFLDDDPLKKGQYIHNKRVLGDRSDIGELVKKHDITEIYFTIPRLSGAETRELLKGIRDQISEEVGVKTIPGLSDLINGRVTFNQLRRFNIKDLLRRKPVHLDFTPVKELIKGRSVLVAGGGGSIGMELCRQIGRFDPERLLILDNSEYNLYTAEEVIKRQYPSLNLTCLVADACNEALMRKSFDRYSPDLVFHAAAYKHVPLMEMNPWSAVHNNLQSTFTLIKMCHEFHVDRFIFISTDKAVQPTSVMGVSKRVCELISLLHKDLSTTKILAVRFGNVLGSSGSVIPKFREQIEDGGPITVTHPEVTRYFMLISEAVELVLQACAVGENGNIYVLDMGEPLSIANLAEYMVELSGLKLNDDIKIVYTGLRPGEKMHERLFLDGEESSTPVPNLFVLNPDLSLDNNYLNRVQALITNLYTLNREELISELKKLVPEYQPDSSDDLATQQD